MTESREEQRIVMAIDLSVNHTSVIHIANCITARETGEFATGEAWVTALLWKL